MHKLQREINTHHAYKKQIVTKDTCTNFNKTGRRWFEVLAGKGNNCSDSSVVDGLICYVGCYDSLSCKSGSNMSY